MSIQVQGHFSTGAGALDVGIDDLVLVENGSVLTLFAYSGQNGGLSSFDLRANGSVSAVDQVVFNSGWTSGIADSFALVEDGTGYDLLFGSTVSGQFSLYSATSSGDIGGIETIAGYGTDLARPVEVEATSGGFAIADADGDLTLATQSADGTITGLTTILDDAASHVGFVTALVTANVGGAEILIVGDAAEDGVTTYVLSGGTATLADAAGQGDGIGIMDPTDLAVVEMGGQTYVVAASAQGQNGALTVFHLSGDGTLTATDHIMDNMNTRFGGVQDIAVTEVEGRVYLAAGGADDGMSLFTLLPGGQLQHLDTIENSWTNGEAGQAALADVTAIAMAELSGKLRIIAASQKTAGLTDLSYDVASQGQSFQADDSGQTLTGTTGADILVGGAEDDTLSGGTGADILVDGDGVDALTGGGGADVFVMREDGVDDHIMDFDPVRDRLDLSSWAFFYDPASLVITPNANGAIVEFRGERLILRSIDGAPLTEDEVREAVQSTPDRAMDLSGYDFPEWEGEEEPEGGTDPETGGGEPGEEETGGGETGGGETGGSETGGEETGGEGTGGGETEGSGPTDPGEIGGGGTTPTDPGTDDILKGSDADDVFDGGGGDDTLSGGAGDDTLNGGDGDDILKGGDGHDTLWGDGGNDQVDGGGGRDALGGGTGDDFLWGRGGNDVLWGGADNDMLNGGGGKDDLNGGSGNDRLIGGKKKDVLTGEDGADVLKGGTGNDVLDAGYGWDTLEGGKGSDTFFAGGGNDVLKGGGGQDVFVFRTGDGNDRIKDFSGKDIFVLDGVDPALVNVSQSGSDVVIEWGEDSVTLEDYAGKGFDINDIEFDWK